LNKYIGYGSVTDGTFKLEIHILNFSIDDYYKLNLNKGDKVEVIGVIQTNGNKFIINKINMFTYIIYYLHLNCFKFKY